jgi:hypothetical protein
LKSAQCLGANWGCFSVPTSLTPDVCKRTGSPLPHHQHRRLTSRESLRSLALLRLPQPSILRCSGNLSSADLGAGVISLPVPSCAAARHLPYQPSLHALIGWNSDIALVSLQSCRSVMLVSASLPSWLRLQPSPPGTPRRSGQDAASPIHAA